MLSPCGVSFARALSLPPRTWPLMHQTPALRSREKQDMPQPKHRDASLHTDTCSLVPGARVGSCCRKTRAPCVTVLLLSTESPLLHLQYVVPGKLRLGMNLPWAAAQAGGALFAGCTRWLETLVVSLAELWVLGCTCLLQAILVLYAAGLGCQGQLKMGGRSVSGGIARARTARVRNDGGAGRTAQTC